MSSHEIAVRPDLSLFLSDADEAHRDGPLEQHREEIALAGNQVAVRPPSSTEQISVMHCTRAEDLPPATPPHKPPQPHLRKPAASPPSSRSPRHPADS